MAEASFEIVMPYVFADEGGYVDHPEDPGGATNMGITFDTLQDWRGQPITKADVKALTQSEAMAIYGANYWDKIKGDDLPAGVDYAVLDFAINSGPKRAAEFLQRMVGVEDDGKIGPVTLAATAKAVPSELVASYCDARLRWLKGLDTWDTFGKNWERRVKDVRKHALELTAKAPEPVPVPETGITLEELEQRVVALERNVAGLRS